jgi:hypothetical protein
MFFYNQRALSFLIGGFFSISLLVLASFPNAPQLARLAAWLVGGAWLLDGLITLTLHARLVKNLRVWSFSSGPEDLPAIFEPYFALDSIVLLALVAIGRWCRKLPRQADSWIGDSPVD